MESYLSRLHGTIVAKNIYTTRPVNYLIAPRLVTEKQRTQKDLNAQRKRAVQLRMAGSTLASVRAEVGLSTPTIVAAVKAFKQGGWPAVEVKSQGRPRLNETKNTDNSVARDALFAHLIAADCTQLWSNQRVCQWLEQDQQIEVSVQTVAGYLQAWQLLPDNQYRQLSSSTATAVTTWLNGEYKDFKARAKRQGATVLWLGARQVNDVISQLHAHTLRGKCTWMTFNHAPTAADYKTFLTQILSEYPKGIALVCANKNIDTQTNKFSQNNSASVLSTVAPSSTRASSTTHSDTNKINPASLQRENNLEQSMTQPLPSTRSAANDPTESQVSNQASNDAPSGNNALPFNGDSLTHLQRLEAESIHIMREVIAEADNPVMLYSTGKDSAVMLHLAQKAFFPARPPFPLLHIDTNWKFQEMYRYRDQIVQELGFELITHTNPEGLEKGVNPITHGSALHTDIMKTDALKQALEKHGFDMALGGARRDEEKSRAKERVFSFRTAQHRWEPKNQRPELWNVYNARKQPGESIRVFPLSNWTELDIWQYIHLQNIPVVPLYFAAERPVVERDGALIMVDDDRMKLNDGEVPMMRTVRFRSLGCYPLTGAMESTASNTSEIIKETLLTKTSERDGRMIDNDAASSMEKKKQEGYF